MVRRGRNLRVRDVDDGGDAMSTRAVRVRIAVSISRNGRWTSHGWSGMTDEQAAALADVPGCAPASCALRFIEADVPLPPEPPVVQGEVVVGEKR